MNTLPLNNASDVLVPLTGELIKAQHHYENVQALSLLNRDEAKDLTARIKNLQALSQHIEVLCNQSAHMGSTLKYMAEGSGITSGREAELQTGIPVLGEQVNKCVEEMSRFAAGVGALHALMTATEVQTELYVLSDDLQKKTVETATEADQSMMLSLELMISAAKSDPKRIMMIAGENMNAHKAIALQLEQMRSLGDQGISLLSENLAAAAHAKTDDLIEAALLRQAAEEKRMLASRMLNMNLTATVKDQELNVSFYPYLSPFGSNTKPEHNTVKEYYILLVKEAHQSLFTLQAAEQTITAGPLMAFKIKAGETQSAKKKQKDRLITESISISGKNGQCDVNGERIIPGEKYVAFLLVVFTEEYQRYRNNYSGLLTAPSFPFSITGKSKAAETAPAVTAKMAQAFIIAGVEADLRAAGLVHETIQVRHDDLMERSKAMQLALENANAMKKMSDEAEQAVSAFGYAVQDLVQNFGYAVGQTEECTKRLDELVLTLSMLNGKVNVLVELSAKLGSTLNKRKAMNPLISIEMISMSANLQLQAESLIRSVSVALRSAVTLQLLAVEVEYRKQHDAARVKEIADLIITKGKKNTGFKGGFKVLQDEADKVAGSMLDKSRDLEAAVSKCAHDLAEADARIAMLNAALSAIREVVAE